MNYAPHTQPFSFALAVFGFLFIAFSVLATWTPPVAAPPASNVSAPLNVTATGQTKSGGLILNTGGAATGLIVDKGKVGIGTIDPGSFLLKVAGEISAGANKIREVATPVATDDAATKGYVDAQAGGGGGMVITWGSARGTNNVPFPAGGTGAPACPQGYLESYPGYGPFLYKITGTGGGGFSSDICSASSVLYPSDYTDTNFAVMAYMVAGNTYFVNTCRVCVPAP